MAQNEDLVILDISGQSTMKVRRDIMTKVKGSKLEIMFSGRHAVPLVSKKIFLDRDPDVFSMLVSFLRNDLEFPKVEDKALQERFEMELKHWGLLYAWQ